MKTPMESLMELPRERGGFSLIEVMVAMVIFTVGILGYAKTTTLLEHQATIADMRSERTAALISAIEQVRTLPFDSVASGNDSVGVYRVEWSSALDGRNAKVVRLVTTGPGTYTPSGATMPMLLASVADTFEYRVLAP